MEIILPDLKQFLATNEKKGTGGKAVGLLKRYPKTNAKAAPTP
jgi:hypothetical protein